jgi:hypothetical protein
MSNRIPGGAVSSRKLDMKKLANGIHRLSCCESITPRRVVLSETTIFARAAQYAISWLFVFTPVQSIATMFFANKKCSDVELKAINGKSA